MSDNPPPLARRLGAEALGSFLLFATVIGSGIMGESLAAGNSAVALLGNTIATGAMLFVVITMLGPISGAHFNPAVSAVMAARRELKWRDAAAYAAVQLVAGILGAWAAHLMFDLPILQLSTKTRAGLGQGIGEALATFGLIVTILGTMRHHPQRVAPSVAFYIVAAYWFTSSTSFANPAITIARSLTDSFSGIALESVPMFLLGQTAGALAGAVVGRLLFDRDVSQTEADQT